MFTKPSFAVLAIGIGLSVFSITFVSGLNEWWTGPFPKPLAAFHLEESPALDLTGCAYGPFDDWREIAGDLEAAGYFEGVLQRARTPEGRLHALVGLRAISESLYAAVAESVGRHEQADTITVFTS